MDWQNVQVLVTGAGGFIGSHLVEAMVTRGAHVRAFVHYNSRGDHGPAKTTATRMSFQRLRWWQAIYVTLSSRTKQ